MASSPISPHSPSCHSAPTQHSRRGVRRTPFTLPCRPAPTVSFPPQPLFPRRACPRAHGRGNPPLPPPQGRPSRNLVIPYHTPGDSESPPTRHSEPLRGISLPGSAPLTLCHPNAPQEILLASTHPPVPIPRRLPHLPSSPTTPPPQQRPIPKPTPPPEGTSLVASSPISPHSLSCHPQRPPNIPVGASVERPSPSRVVPLHSPLPIGASLVVARYIQPFDQPPP